MLILLDWGNQNLTVAAALHHYRQPQLLHQTDIQTTVTRATTCSRHMQQTQPSTVRSSNSPRPIMVPRLKDYVNPASDANLVTWTHSILDLPDDAVPASAKTTVRVMLETGPSTFNGALASATNIPSYKHVTQANIIRQFLKVTF